MVSEGKPSPSVRMLQLKQEVQYIGGQSGLGSRATGLCSRQNGPEQQINLAGGSKRRGPSPSEEWRQQRGKCKQVL